MVTTTDVWRRGGEEERRGRGEEGRGEYITTFMIIHQKTHFLETSFCEYFSLECPVEEEERGREEGGKKVENKEGEE